MGKSGKDKKGKGSARSKEGGKDGKDAKKAAAAADKPGGKAPAGAAPAAAPAFQMSPEDLRVVVARWRSEADEFDRAAAAVPVTFDRTLGIAVRAVGKEAFKEALGAWDKDGKGLKMVDFRRCMRNDLKLKATNHDIDKLFDSITGGGGAAAASAKEVLARLSAIAIKAGVPDPVIETRKAEAVKCRAEADKVQEAVEAVEASIHCDAQLASSLGGNAPVIAQLGAIVIKRNLKLGEVVAAWGDVDHSAFREKVLALGVEASDKDIDSVFDELDDDGGGSLDANELKVGLKLLIDASKSNETNTAALEKQTVVLRKAAVSAVATVVKQEKLRTERLKHDEEVRAAAEVERLEKERVEREKQALIAAEIEARKAAEKAAAAEKLAAARGGPKKGGTEANDSKAASEKKISIAEQNAEERKKAEELYLAKKAKFKRKWRPPGLVIVNNEPDRPL